MVDNGSGPGSLVDTTDCLEAVGVFRGWKNFVFMVVVLCLLLLQVCFWLVNTGYVKADEAKTEAEVVVKEVVSQITAEPESFVVMDGTEEIEKAAKDAVAAPNQPVVLETKVQEEVKTRKLLFFDMTVQQLTWFIRMINFVLVLSAILYCLTMLFILKVSLHGRLGGINHISRAFFLSLLFVVFLLPWQKFFGGMVSGMMFTPEKLFSSGTAVKDADIFSTAYIYLRFTGYWLLVLLLLVFSQLRSGRWAKATLRRLEVI